MPEAPLQLARHFFDAQKLIAELPPRLTARNKQIVYDIACPPGCFHSGTIVFSRWKPVPLPAEFDGEPRQTTIDAEEDYFGYEPSSREDVVEWYINFANRSVFS